MHEQFIKSAVTHVLAENKKDGFVSVERIIKKISKGSGYPDKVWAEIKTKVYNYLGEKS
jgi:hypothetical protein